MSVCGVTIISARWCPQLRWHVRLQWRADD
jgi:hypothetical protein